jgi:hypothetical protein
MDTPSLSFRTAWVDGMKCEEKERHVEGFIYLVPASLPQRVVALR